MNLSSAVVTIQVDSLDKSMISNTTTTASTITGTTLSSVLIGDNNDVNNNNNGQTAVVVMPNHNVEFYALPLIFLVGTFCNIMTFCVMRRKKMRHQSTYFYMAVLAVTDEMVLIFGCLNFWIYLNWGTNLTLISNMSCKLVCLLLYATLHFSVWMVVVMTLERFIAVALPLQAMHLCTVKRAKLATSTLLAVILAINAHFLFTHALVDLGERSCTTTSPLAEKFMNKVWPWIDASLYSFVPLILLILFNILIISSLVRASQNIDKLTNRNPNQTKSNNASTYSHHNLNTNNHHVYMPAQYGNHHQQQNGMNGQQQQQQQTPQVSSTNRRLTIMLLVVSTTFLITSTPIVTLQTVELVGGLNNSNLLNIIKGIFLSLQYLNHSINFFLYAVTGKTFRREFLAMFRPWLVKKGAGAGGIVSGHAAANLAAKKAAAGYKPVRQCREFQKPVIRKKIESNV